MLHNGVERDATRLLPFCSITLLNTSKILFVLLQSISSTPWYIHDSKKKMLIGSSSSCEIKSAIVMTVFSLRPWDKLYVVRLRRALLFWTGG